MDVLLDGDADGDITPMVARGNRCMFDLVWMSVCFVCRYGMHGRHLCMYTCMNGCMYVLYVCMYLGI